jgi:replicative DNA helicase
MSKELIEKAKEYLKADLSVLPTEGKVPAINSWKAYQSQRIKEEEVEAIFNKANLTGLGIICGAISGGLEVIDVDTKNDPTGSLRDELLSLIEDNLPELYSKLVIAQSKSGGLHIYYRCSSIAGNLKLATKQTREVIIETRGEGGYVIAPPSPGYTYLQGNPINIVTITPEEREILLNIGRSFNELEESKPIIKSSATTYSSTGLSPFEDYNHRGDIIALLESKGWRVVNQRGQRINLLRPGSTDSKTSGNFHTGLKVLRVFSSSTDFNPDKAYSSSQAFTLLECSGDNKLAYERLLELGYGEPYKGENIKPTQIKTDKIKVEVVNIVNRESSVISTPGQSLKIENIETAIGEEVVITSPGSEAQEEVLKAIDLIQETGKRIYIVEGGKELREYRYQLQAIFNKYGEIQEEKGELTDRDKDSLLDEIVIASNKLQPIDREIFKKEFLSQEAIKELGITQESLSITSERLTVKKETEAQLELSKKTVREYSKAVDSGNLKEAIEILQKGLNNIKVIGDLLPPFKNYNTILEDISTLPPAYKTGYSSLDSFIGFTPGAITLIAGRPSHGKTTFMFNLLLQMSNIYKDEKFYFFSYEEPQKNISVKILNRLIDTDLSGYFREIKDLPKHTNYEFIKHYIRSGRTDIVNIEEGKRLFKELIDSQRIRIIDRNYSVEELSSLVAQITKKDRVGALFIDYIQRMRTERKTQDKRTEVAHISDKTLHIAKESGLPIILGAQLNREAKKEPSLENLKEAGNLEEDANTVISVYCKAREEEETESGDKTGKQKIVDIKFKTLKNREGEVNTTETLDWDRYTGVIKERHTNF